MPTFRRFPRPSHATVVAYLALFIAMSGTAVAASGPLVLGKWNSAGSTTTLSTYYDVPLRLKTGFGRAPLAVNSSSKVRYLNADQLDGVDSTAFQSALRDAYVLGYYSCPNGTDYIRSIRIDYESYQGSMSLCRVR